jgi:uncharacterized membrane-anchored protein
VTGKDRAAFVLIVVALIAAIVELFYKPFGIALPALIVTMVGISISDKHRRLGFYATLAITLGFLIGASFAVWDSRPLY